MMYYIRYKIYCNIGNHFNFTENNRINNNAKKNPGSEFPIKLKTLII